MELWIRSQNKETLIKANDITIEQNMIIGYFDKDTEYEYLGTYKSKERALEVLDEIQDLLMNKVQEHHINKFDVYNGEDRKIYEMPKE